MEAVVIEYPRSLAEFISSKPLQSDISIVVPTLGRPILETCLWHMAIGTVWPQTIIVVDQGQQPLVAEMLARLQEIGIATVYVPSAQRGRAAGINRGLEQVNTRFVAITDDDCFVAADWLETMVTQLRKKPSTILTGRVELAGNDEADFSTVTSREPKLFTQPHLKAHPFIGGNVGLSMAVVHQIGFFDEHPCLASAEDNDYGYRALRLGIPIAYNPDIILFHFHWRDANQRAGRYAEYAFSQGGFYGTHLRRGDKIILMQTIRALVRSPIRWLRGIVTGDTELATNGKANTLNLLPGVMAGWRRKDA